MSDRVLSDWLIAHLDPSVGPLFLGLIGHWDTTRPALIVFFAAYVAFIGWLLFGIHRYFTR